MTSVVDGPCVVMLVDILSIGAVVLPQVVVSIRSGTMPVTIQVSPAWWQLCLATGGIGRVSVGAVGRCGR